MAKRNDTPTLDEWLRSMDRLATLVEKALAQKGSVKRSELQKAVRAFRRVDHRAM